MKFSFSSTAALLAAAVCCALAVAPAGAAVDLADKTDEAKQRIESVSAALQADRGKLDSAQSEADAAAAKEEEVSATLEGGLAQSAELKAKVEASQKALDEARARLSRARKALADRLVSIYMSGSPDTLDLAMSSESFEGFVSRDGYLDAVQNADATLAGRVEGVRNEVEAEGNRQKRLKAKVDAHNAELQAAQASIAAVRASAEQSAAELAALNADRAGEITTLKSDIDQWTEQIAKQKAREAADAAEADSAAAAEVDSQLGGPYSIPTYIVMCESGGDYSALNPSSGAGGAYQIMPSTWLAYGGKGLPNEASKAEQDRIAALIYADSGTSPWVCG